MEVILASLYLVHKDLDTIDRFLFEQDELRNVLSYRAFQKTQRLEGPWQQRALQCPAPRIGAWPKDTDKHIAVQ